MRPNVVELKIDEENAEEMARHGVRPREVEQVLDGAPRFFRNSKGHRAEYIMIGPTAGGRMLTVPLARTPRPELWRPATAWESATRDRTPYFGSR